MDELSAGPNRGADQGGVIGPGRGDTRWPEPDRAVFARAAFGDCPGVAADALPSASGAVESWLRAVILGGQGRYAGARAELRRTHRHTRVPELRSLALSTEASLLRQLGWHACAAELDGRALALVIPAAPHGATRWETVRVAAVCDALTGLAADALGTARPELSVRLLERCHGFLSAFPDTATAWRERLRWHWVSAETVMAAPDIAWATAGPNTGSAVSAALRHAEAASALAERCPSVRHRVKTRLLLAAAAAAAGELDRCRVVAEDVATASDAHHLLPLRWACAMLRSGVAEPAAATRAAAEAAACTRELAGHGGFLRSDTGG